MNKLGKREYTKLVIEAMTKIYGNTLWEDDTDVKMAKKVVEELSDYLFFHELDMSVKSFRAWRKRFIKKMTEGE